MFQTTNQASNYLTYLVWDPLGNSPLLMEIYADSCRVSLPTAHSCIRHVFWGEWKPPLLCSPHELLVSCYSPIRKKHLWVTFPVFHHVPLIMKIFCGTEKPIAMVLEGFARTIHGTSSHGPWSPCPISIVGMFQHIRRNNKKMWMFCVVFQHSYNIFQHNLCSPIFFSMFPGNALAVCFVSKQS